MELNCDLAKKMIALNMCLMALDEGILTKIDMIVYFFRFSLLLVSSAFKISNRRSYDDKGKKRIET